MLTFTCPNCGTVTTVGAETKPHKPEMETKFEEALDVALKAETKVEYDPGWICKRCHWPNPTRRLTCQNCEHSQ